MNKVNLSKVRHLERGGDGMSAPVSVLTAVMFRMAERGVDLYLVNLFF